jgi:hypothetical protein
MPDPDLSRRFRSASSGKGFSRRRTTRPFNGTGRPSSAASLRPQVSWGMRRSTVIPRPFARSKTAFSEAGRPGSAGSESGFSTSRNSGRQYGRFQDSYETVRKRTERRRSNGGGSLPIHSSLVVDQHPPVPVVKAAQHVASSSSRMWPHLPPGQAFPPRAGQAIPAARQAAGTRSRDPDRRGVRRPQ